MNPSKEHFVEYMKKFQDDCDANDRECEGRSVMISYKSILVAVIAVCVSVAVHAQSLSSFAIAPFDENQFTTFVHVFSDMRGPLRSEILKDHKTDFKNADPLKYVTKIKDNPKVQQSLKNNNITWDQFVGLMGNIVLAYLNSQPQNTKVAIIQKLGDYDLSLADDQIPPEYREQIKSLLTSKEGASLASFVLEQVIQIPTQNTAIVIAKSRTLDQLFYTRFWRGKL